MVDTGVESQPDAEPPGDAETAGARRVLGWAKDNAAATHGKALQRFEANRHRAPVDLAVRLYERDRDSAGALIGSAVAFRLFLFFVPMLLAIVGLAGFLSSTIEQEDVEGAGITGSLARQINTALTQPGSTRWIATLLGLVGMASAGRTLSKVLAAASCLAWNMPVRAKASARAIGATIGLVVGIALVATLITRIRHSLGIGVAGVSFLAAVGIYIVAWILLFVILPWATADPGAVLPGAALLGVTLASLQAFSQLYLPGRFSKASQLYGAVGVTVVTLGWFFIMGRVIVIALAVNAVVYERLGSISGFVFGLPVLRAIPRRWSALARFFGLDDSASGAPAAGEAPPDAPDDRQL